MERSSVIVVDDESQERHVATLTLKRGAAKWAAWGFDGQDAGTTISMGGGAGCDWPVAAPGVGPLLVLFTGESLLIKNEGPSGNVWLNGAHLWPGWVPLEHGDIVELGACSMQVAILAAPSPDLESGERLLHAELPQFARASETDLNGGPAKVRGTVRELRPALRTFSPGVSAHTPTARVLPFPSGQHTALARVKREPVTNTQVRERHDRAHLSPVVLGVPSQEDPTPPMPDLCLSSPEADILPSILGEELPGFSGASIMRAMWTGSAFVLAYAGWIVLLDHL